MLFSQMSHKREILVWIHLKWVSLWCLKASFKAFFFSPKEVRMAGRGRSAQVLYGSPSSFNSLIYRLGACTVM